MLKYKEIKFKEEHEKIEELIKEKNITIEELILLVRNIEVRDIEQLEKTTGKCVKQEIKF